MRVLQFLLGLSLMSLGIALSLHADLGTSPISAIPAVMHEATSWSVGQVSIAMNIFFVALQVLLLRRAFRPVQLVQVLVAVLFGLLCDVALWATRAVDPQTYVGQWGWTLLATLVLGVGVFFQVRPRLTNLPGEGLVVALVAVTGRPFLRLKVAVDLALVGVAALTSLVLLGHVVGLREGTLLMALLVGPVVRLCRGLDPAAREPALDGAPPQR